MVRARHDNPPSRLRFVLTGSFHGLNRGDSAMQLATIAELRRRWPRAEIAVHLPYPEDDRELYAGCEIVACSRRRPWRALRALAAARWWRLSGRRTRLSAELQSYRDAAIVVDLSGDGLTETFGLRCPLSHSVPLLLAHAMQTPFCLMAQTIGPFRRLRPWFRRVLRRAAFITARDQETFDDLSRWHLPCPVERTADVAFLLEAARASEAEDRLRALGGWDASRPLVGITPSNLYNVRAARRTGTTAEQQAPPRALAEASRRLVEETNAQLLLIPHVFGPGRAYDDRRACTALKDLLSPAVEPLVVSDALAPAELKALIGRCDVYVSMRMHSVIAATSQVVPTLAVAYSPKLEALMARLGMDLFVVDCTRLERGDLVEPLRRLWAERESVRDALRQVMEEDVLPQAARNFDILARMIELSPAP